MKDLFKLSVDKEYYKPILVKSGYNNNYVQYKRRGDKILTLKEYLDLIEKYLRKLINYYKNNDEWKVQLIAEISFISLKPGSDEMRIMHTRSDNEEFMNGSDTDEIIKGLFESFLQKYEESLQEKMKGSDFEFDGVNFLYYDFNKISINRGGSYIDSPKWLKDKKSTIKKIFCEFVSTSKKSVLTSVLSSDTVNFRVPSLDWLHPFLNMSTPKTLNHLFICMNLYQHAKNDLIPSAHS